MSIENEKNQNEIEINNNEKESTNQNYQEEIMETLENLKVNFKSENPKNNENPKNDDKNIKPKKETIIDTSVLALKDDELKNNEIINEINQPKTQEEKIAKKPNFRQRTKSWFGKVWKNVKNYDYSKFNIFKKEEMEECLDAHGFPMKIPKKKHKTKPAQKEQY